MIGFIIRVAVVALGLWLATKIVPGVHYTSVTSLALAALLLGVVNAIVRPILVLLTLPVTLVTLGLFLLVINGLMIELVTVFIHGFVVHGLVAAILCAIVVWITSLVVSTLIGSDGRLQSSRR
jgi:putative membrane protein